jgi:hypothetical protein
LNRLRVVSTPQRQRLIVKLSELTNCFQQLAERKLPVFDNAADSVFHDAAFQIDRLSGWSWQFNPSHILENPSDFLKVLSGTFAGSSGCL